jgi:hypothetical protein
MARDAAASIITPPCPALQALPHTHRHLHYQPLSRRLVSAQSLLSSRPVRRHKLRQRTAIAACCCLVWAGERMRKCVGAESTRQQPHSPGAAAPERDRQTAVAKQWQLGAAALGVVAPLACATPLAPPLRVPVQRRDRVPSRNVFSDASLQAAPPPAVPPTALPPPPPPL